MGNDNVTTLFSDDFPYKVSKDGTIPFGETVTIREVRFGLLRLNIRDMLASSLLLSLADTAQIHEQVDHMLRGMVYDLSALVVGDKTITDVQIIRYPKTWWDGFKHRFFAPRLLKYWPVEWHEEKIVCTTITRCCPHLHIEPKKDHVDFLLYR